VEDYKIIRQVREGEREAFAILVEKYHHRLLNFIHRIVGDKELVEDLGQEIFLSVYKSLSGFDEKKGTPFSAWLFIIARNHAVSALRKNSQHYPVAQLSIDHCHDHRDGGVEILLDREKRMALEHSLAQLPEKFRRVIIQSLEGKKLEDIAQAETIALGTVKSRLFRAKIKMRELITLYFKD